MPTNNLVYALAAPNKIGDTSWIKPGKVAWDWWNDWNLKVWISKAGNQLETYKYYIDFAHNHGLEYIVLDEGWFNSKEGKHSETNRRYQLPKLIEYGKSKGAWISCSGAVFNVMDENLETICKTMPIWASRDSRWILWTATTRPPSKWWNAWLPAPPSIISSSTCTASTSHTALNRTYPNILNYESVFGMEECRWTEAKRMICRSTTSPSHTSE